MSSHAGWVHNGKHFVETHTERGGLRYFINGKPVSRLTFVGELAEARAVDAQPLKTHEHSGGIDHARASLSKRSRNSKTGPIPVSTTSADTCPNSCPLKNGGGCYAESNIHLRQHWRKVSNGSRGMTWDAFCAEIAALPDGQLWRHNQAGDLPGDNNAIDSGMLNQLVTANVGKRGFTYTHKPMTPDNRETVASANANGLAVNLSGNNLSHADELAALEIAPVVVVLPAAIQGNVKVATPQGRRVVVCPATYREDVTCASCGLCQVRDRKVIVGFPAHGAAVVAANHVAEGG